ncbi:unnamed protein product [Coregonus sp. 'balchen']|nr:unnamed protein product [Coregonus sp. 'balchen']
MGCILFFIQPKRNEVKHDNISSPGISDQEKEIAANALEAFTVHTSMEDIDGLDDVENSLLYYNQAIIHYHMRQYSEAIAIGEKLYQFLEPFEEKFALAVCFLLVDLYLLTYQPEKALHLLAVLEKLSVQGNNKNGKGEVIFQAQCKFYIHRDPVVEAADLIQDNLREITGGQSANSTNKDGRNQKAEFIGMIEAAKSKMHQYKVRAYIQMKSSKACKREIKSVMNTAGNVSECVRCMFWNNLGCIHFAMGKHNLGIFYFKKALQENDHTCAQLGDGGATANKRYELLYNCGIQLLHIGRPLAAFECLMEAVQVYHSNPRLWLRLAECCIAANKGSLEQENKGLPSKKGIVQAIVGQGYHRKIILASQSSQNTIYSDGQSAAIPVASMEFAAICLRNGLVLLPDHQQQETKAENGSKTPSQSGSTESGSENSDACSGKGQEGDKFLSAAPSSPLRKQEVENLRCSLLACSAYVALAFLGHLYAAEALISLDRISEAIAHLNPENVTDVSLGVLSSEQDQAGKQTPLCYPSTVSSARAIMLFNLGSAYCLRSEYEKARKCLHQAASMVNTKEIPPEAILLAVYLELQNGNTQLALQIIKRNQLLPSVLQTPSPDTRKKPVPSSFQPVQPPIQMPSPFTTVQRK